MRVSTSSCDEAWQKNSREIGGGEGGVATSEAFLCES